MRSFAIIGLCIASAVIYGILHDQITARVCVEYFTIGHAPVFGTDDPTLLAIGWGVIATWWVGVLLGIPLAFAARMGNRPKRCARSLVKPIGFLLSAMGLCAFIAGLVGWLLSSRGVVSLAGTLGIAVPQDKHVAFITVAWAHSASYAVGFVGGCILITWVWQVRGRAAKVAVPE